MQVTPQTFPEVRLIVPKMFSDQRGHFLEIFQAWRHPECGMPSTFVQDNISFSLRGVVRGPALPVALSPGEADHAAHWGNLGRGGGHPRGSPTFGKRREAVGRPKSPLGREESRAVGPGPTLDSIQETRDGAAPSPRRAHGTSLPGVGGSRSTAWKSGADAALAGMEEALKARNGDPLKGELDNAMKRLGELDHGRRVVVGPGEAPWPFSQKEVEEMSCTASAATARPSA